VKHYSNLTLQFLLFIGQVHKAQNHWFWPLCCCWTETLSDVLVTLIICDVRWWDGFWCLCCGYTCCGYRLGTSPRNLKYKASQDRGRQQKRPGTRNSNFMKLVNILYLH